MKKYFALYTIVYASLFLAGFAHAGNLYFGVGSGVAFPTNASGNVTSGLETISQEGVSTAITYDDHSVAVSALAGYQFNPNVALEFTYQYLGNYQLNAAASSETVSLAASEQDTVNAISLAGVLALPVTPTFSIYGKGGIAISLVDETCSITGFACSSNTTTKAGGIVGFGGQVTLYNQNALRLEFDDLPGVGDKNADYTAGNFFVVNVQYIFSL